jgi:pyroglutamyl-peptidase
MKILLTGFEPFGGSTINPSEQAARALDQQIIAGAAITCAILPVDWQMGPRALLTALHTCSPDAVLCLGEAPSRPVISVERVAVNLLDFTIPDNSGAALIDQPVLPGGPAAYFATLPVRPIFCAIQAAGVPAELSLTAGSYLCNAVLYHLLHYQAGQPRPAPSGFIHLPRLPRQAAAANQRGPTMSLEAILTALQAALETIAALPASLPNEQPAQTA